jgi:D-xylose 1-dehydrogenase (NADP+, D-xylono-1,5-lactone-forming)
MADDALRWGVLGTAAIARRAVIPAIQASLGSRLVAVASREPQRAEHFAHEVGAERAHGSYEALLGDEQVEAVYVPLPNALHGDWTVRAAAAGKHVLCEKPLGVSPAECRRMYAAADTAGLQLMEAFMYRHHPRTQRLLGLVREGALGDLRWLHASFSFMVTDPANVRFDAALAGGALMDVGCYAVDVARALVGEEPLEAQAHAVWAPSGVDETLVGTLRFPGGVVAHVSCSLAATRTETYEVVGTEGRLRVTRAFLPGRGACEALIERPDGAVERLTFDGVDEYHLMVEAFEHAVRTGDLPALGQDGALNLRAIEGLYASAHAAGRLVPLAGAAA